jgi:hypothetical protein
LSAIFVHEFLLGKSICWFLLLREGFSRIFEYVARVQEWWIPGTVLSIISSAPVAFSPPSPRRFAGQIAVPNHLPIGGRARGRGSETLQQARHCRKSCGPPFIGLCQPLQATNVDGIVCRPPPELLSQIETNLAHSVLLLA